MELYVKPDYLDDFDDSLEFYHENLSRKDCEKLLHEEYEKHPEVEGFFLLRESSLPKYKFVLSCYSKVEFRHFCIEQHGLDSFFSLDDKNIIHGLDDLIMFYQQNNSEIVNLSTFEGVRGVSIPSWALKTGSSRELHRAVLHYNLTFIREFVRTRSNELDEKDTHGRTALHLAALDDKISLEVSRLLIDAGASLIIRDKHGRLAFSYACEHNRLQIVDMMISKDSEVIQRKDSETYDTSLHVAAKHNRLAIAQILLANGAAIWSKNKANKFPIDCAADERHADVVILLERHRPPIITSQSDWLHGNIPRQDAENLLIQEQKVLAEKGTDALVLSGLFLVRFSEKRNRHVLSMLKEGKVFNFEIFQTSSLFHLNQGSYAVSIEELISHFMKFADGLPTKLTLPVKPETESLYVVLVDPKFSVSNPIYFDSPEKASDSVDSDGNPIYDEPKCAESRFSIYDKLHIYAPVTIGHEFDGLFIDESLLELSSVELGHGFFGTVKRGIFVHPGKRSYSVAVKTLHINDLESEEKQFCSFLREAAIMLNFDNPFIVKMHGIVKGPPMQIVQALQPLGSLINYLRKHHEEIESNDINIWAAQIASGMAYFESKNFVHRDLAARNILLASKTHARIGDFGLSRTISVENKRFRTDENERLPLKWYAPECFFKNGEFTHASDVWSFAVTLWEAYTKGEEPYENMGGWDATVYVERGYRLAKPEACPRHIYEVLLECWLMDKTKRPTFKDLAKIFTTNSSIYENTNLLARD